MRKDIPLSDKLKNWRIDRPDEWTMDIFIRDATTLEGLIAGYLKELSDLHDEIRKLNLANDSLSLANGSRDMLMYDDKREIKYYNNDISQESIIVGRDGVTKIEVYKEHGNGDFIPYLAVWKGDVLFMRTPAIGKEIVYA